MTTRLRFVKPWSTYRVGDTLDTDSPTTVERMVRVHGFCVIDGAITLESLLDADYKALDAPVNDKMLRAAGKAKMRRGPKKG